MLVRHRQPALRASDVSSRINPDVQHFYWLYGLYDHHGLHLETESKGLPRCDGLSVLDLPSSIVVLLAIF